jgi:cytochrome P450
MPVSSPSVFDGPVIDGRESIDSEFQFDSLLQPEFAKAPQPYYRRMRDTNPVLRMPDMYGSDRSNVFVAKHSDVEYVLRNPEMFSSDFLPPDVTPFPLIPENIDPPQHLKYRRLLDPLFGPKPMKRLESDICRRANELIDRFVERGECDFTQEFAMPLPCGVFLDLMGLPSDDLDFFLQLKEDMLRGQAKGNEYLLAAKERANQRFESLFADRRSDPRDDLLTQLVNARIDDQPLTTEELLGICQLMIVAGLDTVTDSLTCFYALFATHPEHRRRLVKDPAIIPTVIEELLRFESPVPFVPRIVTKDTELSGCPVKAGDQLVLLLGAANTDEQVHDRPDVVDFDRVSNRHFGFGGGIHRCLGSHLARIELQVSLREWHRRIPEYHIADGTELEYTPLLRQVAHLPLVFETADG